jgi:hypothetical protein
MVEDQAQVQAEAAGAEAAENIFAGDEPKPAKARTRISMREIILLGEWVRKVPDESFETLAAAEEIATQALGFRVTGHSIKEAWAACERDLEKLVKPVAALEDPESTAIKVAALTKRVAALEEQVFSLSGMVDRVVAIEHQVPFLAGVPVTKPTTTAT